MELLQADVKKWHTRKEWYEAINEVHEHKHKLENMIAWAQVEEWEKKAASSKDKTNNQSVNLEKVY